MAYSWKTRKNICGSDFHSAALKRGCEQHGIQIEYRPPGQPHYGGIIERVIGTMMNLVHDLPGTTFSNIHVRGDYNSDRHACLTLSELDRWLMIAITQYYHVKIHRGIHEPPLKKYEHGVDLMKLNGKSFAVIHNAKAFFIDFLPIEHRLLRRDGFVLDHIAYYSDALKPFIRECKKHGKFLIRKDPRDLSRIYVYIAEEDMYLEVPYRMLSRPAISLFEHRMALKRLRAKEHKMVNEESLFRAIEEARHIVSTAAFKTRLMRRNRTRISENTKIQPSKREVSLDIQVAKEHRKPFDVEFWE